MKIRFIFFLLLVIAFVGCKSSQSATTKKQDKISTIDLVQIINNNKEEAIFYYKNNWKVLREMALEKGYIDSFELFEMTADKDDPFEIILITTYKNEWQYEKREEHFTEIMKLKGGLKLLNDKKPNEFRNTVFSKNLVKNH